MEVYRVLPENADCAIGAPLQIPHYEFADFSDRKMKLEMKLEEIRQKEYANLPSRLNSLFVCHSLDCADYWATSKFGHKSVDYLLLKLHLDEIEHLFWFDSDCYMEYPYIEKNLDVAYKRYWMSAKQGTDALKEESEGLFVGKAVVSEIIIMHHNEDGNNFVI